jgi:CheY-like chemotaxis protein
MEREPGQPRVLVVSGDPIARDIQAQFLRMAGYDVALAETGERALLILRRLRHRIDWLFTATALSGLVDGWMLADEFHRTHPARAVILASDTMADRSAASGLMLFLANPTSPAELVAELHRLSGRGEPPARAAAPSLPLVTPPASIPPAPLAARPRRMPRRAAS